MELNSFIDALSGDELWPWLVIAVPIWIATYFAKAFLKSRLESSQESKPVGNDYV